MHRRPSAKQNPEYAKKDEIYIMALTAISMKATMHCLNIGCTSFVITLSPEHYFRVTFKPYIDAELT